ncbi:hypothetical protein GGX14DRAFT_406582 [Mycena pura]|uniref:Metallo-beta-lactamase domain-containing protein n=1 Tax=Mycena pura TaxID=153505 RepID=A0AAD6UPR8_9AGAR|nr:hypothetical protein GGX14DRAFT_406582 [Mycena pura]
MSCLSDCYQQAASESFGARQDMAASAPKTASLRQALDMQLTFLGTAAAQRSSTRSHSSLALRLGGDVWLFDCGEGTQRQLQIVSVTDLSIYDDASINIKVAEEYLVKMGRIEKIFITHLYGDHVFGVAPLLAGTCILDGAGGTADGEEDPREFLDVNNQ